MNCFLYEDMLLINAIFIDQESYFILIHNGIHSINIPSMVHLRIKSLACDGWPLSEVACDRLGIKVVSANAGAGVYF